MAITLTSGSLVSALQMLVGLVERKHTMPILSHVLFEASVDGVSLTTTDNQMEMSYVMSDVDVTEPVIFTVSARKLFDIFKVLPDQSDARIQLQSGSLKINADGSEFMLLTQPADAFPRFSRVDSGTHISLPLEIVKNLCKQTLFAASLKDFRASLTGVLLKSFDDHLVAVGCDGSRMAVIDQTIDNASLGDVEVILPRKTVLEFMKLPDVDAKLIFSGNQIEIVSENFVFCSRLIDLSYPDYRSALPQGESFMFRVKHSDLKASLSRVAVMSNESTRAVMFALSDNKLHLQACNKEHETADDELVLEYEGPSVEVVYKADYLTDALSCLSDCQLVYGTFYAECKSLILSDDANESRRTFLIMPLKL